MICLEEGSEIKKAIVLCIRDEEKFEYEEKWIQQGEKGREGRGDKAGGTEAGRNTGKTETLDEIDKTLKLGCLILTFKYNSFLTSNLIHILRLSCKSQLHSLGQWHFGKWSYQNHDQLGHGGASWDEEMFHKWNWFCGIRFQSQKWRGEM